MSQARAPRVFLVAAVAANGIIGADGKLPWRLPEDLKHFKALTLGHPVIMGRKTWESLGRPLPGRENIVVTRSAGYDAPGASVAASLEAALALCAGEAVVFVIGGSALYAAALPLARSFRAALLTAVALGVLAVWTGLTASFYLDLAPGATIVM